ncbi:MAG: hypothetical protein LBF19_02470, partial [Prevotellaceae bacterium]|nr:hypothetical protein [Prevotellaceae bacterium]
YMKMKKTLLLSLLSLASLSVWGQSVVRITQLGADYAAAPPTVSFRVYWDSAPDNITHLDSVWLFVDYQPIAANGSLGAWTPATLSAPAANAPGTVIAGSLNGRGFYLRGTTPTFSSTVTVALDGLVAGDRFNWCAYASDYPPNATEGAGYYELHGTPPFLINGAITEPTRHYTGCITSLTDRTGCPGLVPSPTAVTDFTVSEDTICVGEGVTLEAIATGATMYSFNGGQTWIPATASTTTIVFPTHDTVYTVHVANAAGCSATAPAETVTVHPLPIATFNSPPSTACAGSLVTLTVGDGSGSYCFSQHCSASVHNPYASGNDDPTEYDCIFESATCTFETSNSYAVTMPDSGNVTVCVRVVNEHGCLDSACITIGVMPVSVPVLAGGGAYCDNADLSCFGETGYSYQLQDGLTQAVGAPLSGAGAPLNFPITVTGAYTVVATDVATSCVVRSNAQAVTVDTSPTAPARITADYTCSNSPVTLTVSGGSNGSGARYEWGTGATPGVSPLSPAVTVANFIDTPSVVTTYWVRRIGTTACRDTTAGVTLHVPVAVINGTVGRDQPVGAGQCQIGLVPAGGYCRDLIADGAICYTGCQNKEDPTKTLEMKAARSANGTSTTPPACPAGWRRIYASELQCYETYTGTDGGHTTVSDTGQSQGNSCISSGTCYIANAGGGTAFCSGPPYSTWRWSCGYATICVR